MDGMIHTLFIHMKNWWFASSQALRDPAQDTFGNKSRLVAKNP
jgi:hypothetical protein